ncbi:hypothetical protein ACGCUQ_05025 [Eubacteriales bacterium KG127]
MFFAKDSNNKEYSFRERNARPMRIGVVGAGNGVGTTEFAVALAFWVSNRYFLNIGNPKISFCHLAPWEGMNSNFINRYNLINRFEKSKFIDIYSISFIKNLDNGVKSDNKFNLVNHNEWNRIVWVVPGYNSISLLNKRGSNNDEDIYRKSIEILNVIENNPECEIVICDLGHGYGKEELMNEMDFIVGITSPFLYRIIDAREDIKSIEYIRRNGKDICWIVNGNVGVGTRRLIRQELVGGQIKFFPTLQWDMITYCDKEKLFLCEKEKNMEEFSNIWNSMANSIDKKYMFTTF